jgi:hypothetical protein
MNTVAQTSAVQIPRISSDGNTRGGSARQGSGRCQNARMVMMATAKIANGTTERCDSTVAATVTGARIRIENGFSSPPVRYSSRLSCSRS